MSAPKRIQRRRTKGWKMPPNTVYVGRPTKWGNPFSAQLWSGMDRRLMIALYRNLFYGWDPSTVVDFTDDFVHAVYDDHNSFLGGFYRRNPLECAEFDLRGKDLACWCPLDQPCHADVLLEIANS